MRTLHDARIGQTVLVTGIRTDLGAAERRRLGELGFCEGARVRFLRRAPFGGPHVYEVCGSVFSVEPHLAALIDVDPSCP